MGLKRNMAVLQYFKLLSGILCVKGVLAVSVCVCVCTYVSQLNLYHCRLLYQLSAWPVVCSISLVIRCG